MADDSQRAKARATFGKTFFDNAKPKPLAKNAATASQKVANSRPIPTYKDGGNVMPERIAARIAAGNYGKGGKVQTSADTARKLATEMGGMKDGGSYGMKPVKKAVGGAGKTRKGMAPIKKKDGGTIKLDLNQVKRETALRDAAAKKRAEAERYRKMMGSQEDILARGERSQARDAEEARSMKPVKRARGGAGKVRKGMMTPKGDIKQAVNPKKGIGGFM
jgi:hypothetical protein